MSAPSPLAGLLLAVADDEFVLGYRNSEWTGIAPMLEEDVALSSMAQDEIGHARLFYEMAAELTGRSADAVALAREPGGLAHCQLVERPRGDWAYTMARQFLYDAADEARLKLMSRSSHVPIVQAVNKIIREEKYHRMHDEVWLDRLAQGSDESRRRLFAALEALWPDMPGFFEPVSDEAALVADGILPAGFGTLVAPWWELVRPALERNGLPLPPGAPGTFEFKGAAAGRAGSHTAEFRELWEQMTMVYRSDPEAVW